MHISIIGTKPINGGKQLRGETMKAEKNRRGDPKELLSTCKEDIATIQQKQETK